jgi:hypothetical protein
MNRKILSQIYIKPDGNWGQLEVSFKLGPVKFLPNCCLFYKDLKS